MVARSEIREFSDPANGFAASYRLIGCFWYFKAEVRNFSRGVWELLHLGVTVCGSCALLVTVCGSCSVWLSQSISVALPGGLGVSELRCTGVAVCGTQRCRARDVRLKT